MTRVKGNFSLSKDVSITEGISDFGFKGLPQGGIVDLKKKVRLN